MVIPKIHENSPQQRAQDSEPFQVKQAPSQRGIGQVPDRLEAPQDAGCLSGLFSTLSDCLIALYEGVIYLIQRPFHWLFGEVKKEALPELPKRPRANSNAGLEENPDWNKENLTAAIEAGDLQAQLTTLLEVAAKAGDKDLKVKESEAFEVIQKFNDKDPDAFTAIMTIYCAKKSVDPLPDELTSLLVRGFDFKTFYKAVLEHQLQGDIQQMRAAVNPLGKLDILYKAIPEGSDRKLPRERKQILETVRILMREIPEVHQKSIACYMKAIDQSESYRGALKFAEYYGDGTTFDMATYLGQDRVHLSLVREAIPEAFFGLIYAGFADAGKPISEKLDLLHFAIDRVSEQAQIQALLTQFSTPAENHAAYQAILGGRTLEEILGDKPALLVAIHVMVEPARESEARTALLAQLANGGRCFAEQLALLQPCIVADDREALRTFVTVERQRQLFAARIVENCIASERAQLSALAKPVIDSHPGRDGLGSQLGMLWDSLSTKAMSGISPYELESQRTVRDKAAIEQYLQNEGVYEDLSMELIKISFRDPVEDW